MIKNGNNPIIDLLNKTDKDIMLIGGRGTGKTILLNDALENSANNILIDGTLKNGDGLFLKTTNLYNLYQTCLIIQKIILNIKKYYSEKYINDFVFFEAYIDNLMKQIYFISMTDLYDKGLKSINQNLLNEPEILLDELLNIMSKKLDIKDLTVVIDDFDVVEGSSQRYQKFFYNRIKSYLRLIITVSDKEVINNDELLQGFSNENEIIKLDYSKNVLTVREILNEEIYNNFIKTRLLPMKYNLYFVLSDDTIELMIKKTKGNLFDMLTAIRYLYSNIEKLDRSEYSTFLLDYIDGEINKNPILTGIVVPERKLYIKP